ncbi:MAG: hypothetical protein CFE24_11180 [Flavobacterium sp. BFFFF2]|nr:MAG: hypothetical protein CFE24_11180 [Flavobacterium sp. BFFFF2]
MTFYAGQKGPFFWFVFFGPAKKMNKDVKQQQDVKQKTIGLMKSNIKIFNQCPSVCAAAQDRSVFSLSSFLFPLFKSNLKSKNPTFPP